MNNKKHSISEEEIAVMGWTNIDVYDLTTITGLLVVVGIKVLHDHSFGLAVVEERP